MKERVITYIKTKFGGNWVAERIEYKAQEYLDCEPHEAQDYVREEIREDVLAELGFGADRFEFEAGVEIDELINAIFKILAP